MNMRCPLYSTVMLRPLNCNEPIVAIVEGFDYFDDKETVDYSTPGDLTVRWTWAENIESIITGAGLKAL